MRYSNSFAKTQKEVPTDVTAKSHEYLLRAGFVHQLAGGLYNFLPFGFTVLMKLDRIIKEELAKKGVEHLLMPLIHPASLWEESKRYDKVDVLQKFTSRSGSNYVIAPTHEETITDLARKYINTYKDLPRILNQNQWKYRDELRVTGGLLRTREFLMQDAYSFDRDKKGLDESFKKVSEAYHAIFDRIGIEITVVQADSGTMGGNASEEFMVMTDVGEDRIFVCDKCDYKANVEKAESVVKLPKQDKEMKKMEQVEGKGIIGVEELAKFLKIDVETTTKTLLFQADDKVVAVMVRGDYDISEVKLMNCLGCQTLELATPEIVKKVTSAAVGYAGPVGLPDDVQVIADLTCKDRTNFEAGGNKTDFHNINVNFERDFPTPEFVDIREVKESDGCPKCGEGKLKMAHAVELGHVFKLGTAYSETMGAKFVDDDGKEKLIEMGCYGIGISRLMAAIIEVSNDNKGIIWPKAVAPYHVHLLSLGNDEDINGKADKLYEDLQAAGVEVLYDDRNESPGRKFADADLIGIPLRLVVSSRSVEAGGIEWKLRDSDKSDIVSFEDVIKKCEDFITG